MTHIMPGQILTQLAWAVSIRYQNPGVVLTPDDAHASPTIVSHFSLPAITAFTSERTTSPSRIMALHAPAHPSLLLRLPEEVLAHISTFVDDPSILPLSLTSRKLYRIATSPLGMRQRCLTRWTHWHARHEIHKKRTHRRAGDIDWKRLFLERYNADLATLGYLDRIINTPLHHIELFNRIVDYGNDALDVLAAQAAVGDEVEDKLARQ